MKNPIQQKKQKEKKNFLLLTPILKFIMMHLGVKPCS